MKIVLILLFLLIVGIIYTFFNYDQVKLNVYKLMPFKQNLFTPVKHRKRNILIITAENRTGKYIDYHNLNFKKYADIQGYTYALLENCPKEVATTYWCKIHKVKEALPYYDYVMWADSDTIVPDLSKSLDDLISRYGEPDVIIGKDTWWSKNIHILNAGLFLIKNSETGHQFLDDCLDFIANKKDCIKDNKEQGMWAGICYEQGVMNLLVREKYSDKTLVDNEGKFFLNVVDKIENNEEKIYKTLFLHLAGQPNYIRETVFKSLI